MDVMTAILTRRSEQVLCEPAPGEAEFGYLLRGAAAFPDLTGPGRPDPWRWILLRGADRSLLAGRLTGAGTAGAGTDHPAGAGTDHPAVPGTDGRAGGVGEVAPGPGDAPLLAALVHAPRPGGPLTAWEHLSATSGMVHALILLLHGRGYGSTWHLARPAAAAGPAAALGLAAGERLLGGLAVGTPAARPPARRTLPDIAARLSVLTPAAPAHAR
ncbi:nitroreductase [Streptomyces sp. NPDC089919]|uniref:nitroreductase n=1 Tax=Streptomyces sp. NPDC089919 TaxID=3155188 RepID=UPI00343D5F24